MVDISVIVPVYNSERFLSRCLSSLEMQAGVSCEFILVDDGSTDASGRICDGFRDRDPRFSVCHQDNRGSLLARSRGLSLARGTWCTFVDCDDYLPSGHCLATQLALAAGHGADILRFSSEVVSDGGPRTEEMAGMERFVGAWHGRLGSSDDIVDTIFGKRNLVGWTLWDKVFRTSTIRQAVPVLERHGHVKCATDLFLLAVACRYASSLCSVATPPLYSYRYGIGISNGRVSLEKFAMYACEPGYVLSLARFYESEGRGETCRRAFASLYGRLAVLMLRRFLRLEPRDRMAGLRLLRQSNDMSRVLLAVLARSRRILAGMLEMGVGRLKALLRS